MKIYIHSGEGCALGSEVIVLANNKEEAIKMIRKELDGSSCEDVEIEIEKEIEVKNESQVLYSWNGFY